MATREIDFRGRRLKEATHVLHRSVGGALDARAITGKSKSQHYNFESQNAPDFATIDDIAKMEAVAARTASWPPVTKMLCELAGGVFLPMPDEEAHEGPIALGVITLAKEFGDMAEAVSDGLADGELEPHELLRIQRTGNDLQTELARFMRALSDMIDETPPTVAQLRKREGR